MKKLLLLVLIVGAVFIAYNRQRVFIRDPLGSVTRDGVKDQGAQVFINYSNDVLLENDNAPMYVTLVQRGQPVGTPQKMQCVHYVVCLTDADVATVVGTNTGARIESMTGKVVAFHDSDGREAEVKLH